MGELVIRSPSYQFAYMSYRNGDHLIVRQDSHSATENCKVEVPTATELMVVRLKPSSADFVPISWIAWFRCRCQRVLTTSNSATAEMNCGQRMTTLVRSPLRRKVKSGEIFGICVSDARPDSPTVLPPIGG